MKKQISLPLIQALDSLSTESESDSIRELLYRQGSVLKLDCLNWPEDFPYAPKTRLCMGRSSQGIYLHFVVEEIEKRTTHHSDNSPVWQDSCVEFFVALPSEDEYFNFEFNSLGYCLAAKRKSREEFVLFNPEQLALIKRYPGSANAYPEKPVQVWSLTVYIPFVLLGLDCTCLPEVLKANFYKCCSSCTLKHYLSWNPVHSVKPDFHRPQDFEVLVLEK